MMSNGFRIGELAERAGVSIDTVRYYERRKLLPRAPRTAAGYRVFTSDAVERVAFIKQAQELGFSLVDIGTLLANNGPTDCRNIRDLINGKIADLDAKLSRMLGFQKTLLHFLAECEAELEKHGSEAECPVPVEIAHKERNL